MRRLKSCYENAFAVSGCPLYLWAQTPLFASGWRDMTLLPERRHYPRFTTWLPLRLKSVGGIVEPDPLPLVTQNLSKTGLCFPAPRRIEPGQSIEVEVTLLRAGPDSNNICVSGTGYIVRAESTKTPGWYTLAAAFDESTSDEELEWHKLIAAVDKKS